MILPLAMSINEASLFRKIQRGKIDPPAVECECRHCGDTWEEPKEVFLARYEHRSEKVKGVSRFGNLVCARCAGRDIAAEKEATVRVLMEVFDVSSDENSVVLRCRKCRKPVEWPFSTLIRQLIDEHCFSGLCKECGRFFRTMPHPRYLSLIDIVAMAESLGGLKVYERIEK